VSWRGVRVVDRDAQCALSKSERLEPGAPSDDGIELVVEDWRAFFRTYLGAAASDRAGSDADAIVPSPLMPHLMCEWIIDRARERWPNREVGTQPLESPPDIPWQRAAPGGPHYVSFAEWMCPINCIEPRTCPHTRDLRTWSLPSSARAYVDAERLRGSPLAGPVIFHCTHRAYGVGMFDTRDVLAGDDLVRSLAEHDEAEVLVGTMSHCHGAFERLVVGLPTRHGFAGSRH
jgi:hypothetical protein